LQVNRSYNDPPSKTDYAVDSPSFLNNSCNIIRSKLYSATSATLYSNNTKLEVKLICVLIVRGLIMSPGRGNLQPYRYINYLFSYPFPIIPLPFPISFLFFVYLNLTVTAAIGRSTPLSLSFLHFVPPIFYLCNFQACTQLLYKKKKNQPSNNVDKQSTNIKDIPHPPPHCNTIKHKSCYG